MMFFFTQILTSYANEIKTEFNLKKRVAFYLEVDSSKEMQRLQLAECSASKMSL